jgi:hypothetical protein
MPTPIPHKLHRIIRTTASASDTRSDGTHGSTVAGIPVRRGVLDTRIYGNSLGKEYVRKLIVRQVYQPELMRYSA